MFPIDYSARVGAAFEAAGVSVASFGERWDVKAKAPVVIEALACITE